MARRKVSDSTMRATDLSQRSSADHAPGLMATKGIRNVVRRCDTWANTGVAGLRSHVDRGLCPARGRAWHPTPPGFGPAAVRAHYRCTTRI